MRLPVRAGPSAPGEPPRVCVAASFTADPLEETFRFWAGELDLPFEVAFAPYNQLFQQLLDPGSLLRANPHGLNVALVRLEDLAAAASERVAGAATETDTALEATLGELVAALAGAAGPGTVPWLVVLCPASQAALAEPRRAAALARLEGLAAEALPTRPGLALLRPAELFRLYPGLDYDDPQANRLGHLPFTPAGYAALATLIVRHAHALWQRPRKVIAVDCDQTLWGGVCGEDGPGGLELGPAHRLLEEFLVRQSRAGMLLCLCSKNDAADVAAVFEQRPDLPLRPEHLAAQRVNWRPKSENLRELAHELSLGLDSFILLDDNPVECAEVEANSPEVLVLPLPEPASDWARLLEHVWAFDHLAVTEEDRQRTARYQQNRLREHLRVTAPSLGDFLAGLQLRSDIAPARPEQWPRLAQLTQRTNQFNCTSRRRSEEEMARVARERPANLWAVTVSDRFGEYGLVGALGFETLGEALVVDTFLLSCRVLGKGVEHRMLAHLGQLAQQRGAARVDVPFRPSGRNQPALEFLRAVGARFEQGDDGGAVFRFPAGVAAAVKLDPATSPAAAVPRPEHAAGVSMAGMPSAQALRPLRYAWIARTASDPERILGLIEGRVPVRELPAGAEHIPARTEVQHRLCALWQDVLKLPRVGIRDDFFELGGTSQLAVRLCARIERQLGRKLPLAALFKGPTVEQLAAALEPNHLGSGPA